MSKLPREMGRLSKKERDAVQKINDPDMIARMDKGDRYEQNGDYFNEMVYHREIQEQLRKNHRVYCTDTDSLDAYAYNSAGIHNPSYTQYYSSLGYGFDEMFRKNSRTHHYDKILAKQYMDDVRTIQYHEQSRLNCAYAQSYDPIFPQYGYGYADPYQSQFQPHLPIYHIQGGYVQAPGAMYYYG